MQVNSKVSKSEGVEGQKLVAIEISVGGKRHVLPPLPLGNARELAKQIEAVTEQIAAVQMEAGCPWYISAKAVRDYAKLRRMGDPDREAVFKRAETELIEMAKETVSSGREPKPCIDGSVRYRGSRPHRYGLIVRPESRLEGPLPQLVSVLSPFDRDGGS